VATLSQFAAAHPEIAEVECNPVAVTPHAAIALDARIILATTTTTEPDAELDAELDAEPDAPTRPTETSTG
ncbi:MAG: acetate--CoA ligase family protein, partial [Dermatophilaceae bacterium]